MKKNTFLLILLLLTGYLTRAQMNFIKGQEKSMQQILAEAKAKKQIIFVDVYTTWCGPCKWMDENTFIDKRVSEKFNKQFINFKVDGDTSEGQVVRNLYKVGAYPTYLFIAPEGKVLHRIEGVMPPQVFMDEADFAVRRAKEN
ncbi:thioredoxin family protein [Emticicia sp. BO119]|uniref:thioredoxin family protein n=1 Tax=Emticicia sp. BO119 TaxID=2757768 RepID=UPI0015F02B7E|nr:thioredoxin family protein [Emticicia sp. BO119]MBA4851122.1 thioredoxin family protein [Emticicia sp. BO119]